MYLGVASFSPTKTRPPSWLRWSISNHWGQELFDGKVICPSAVWVFETAMFVRERCGNILHERLSSYYTNFRFVYRFMCHNLYLYTCVIAIDDIVHIMSLCVWKSVMLFCLLPSQFSEISILGLKRYMHTYSSWIHMFTNACRPPYPSKHRYHHLGDKGILKYQMASVWPDTWNKNPANRPKPIMKGSSPNHPLSGVFLVSFRECMISSYSTWFVCENSGHIFLAWVPGGYRLPSLKMKEGVI